MAYTLATIPQAQALYQNRGRGSYAGFYALNGHIDTPSNQDYNIALCLPIKCIFQFVVTKLSAGTLTANFKITAANYGAASSITGLSAIAVTNAFTETDYTANDGTNVGIIGTSVLITVSAVAGAANFDWSLVFLRQ